MSDRSTKRDVLQVGTSAQAEQEGRRARDVIEEWHPRLAAIRDEWAARLPAEAESTWTKGAAYVRESAVQSLGRDAPDTQLRNALEVLARNRVYVAPDAVYFDVQSGTDIAGRAAFQRLFERAIEGDIKAIGVFISERLFRNVEQASQVKRAFRVKGIELHYMGKWEGDQRNPAAWQLETMQDAAAELHARTTSYHVGMAYEQLSRRGQPPGHVPEVFQVVERAPSFMGRQGSAMRWEAVEPLAGVRKEGCERYLDGMSFEQLARWSETTDLNGVTPRGRVMSDVWWRTMLQNPRLAGYQMPTTYMGFKPGKESPPRPQLTIDSELVPCKLPGLWPLDTYYKIRRLGQQRFGEPKVRTSYRSYLLSGITVDARCRHVMRIKNQSDGGRYFMICREKLVGHRPGSWRVDLAEAELDALIGSIQLSDPRLRAAVEDELRRLTANEREARQTIAPNPAIAAARKALASLSGAGFEAVRDQLKRQIADLEESDARRIEDLSEPLVQFRRAMHHIDEWSQVWADADVALKNKMLREAGVRVVLDRFPGARQGDPAHVVSIEADNTMLTLALAAAAPIATETLPGYKSLLRGNVTIRLDLDPSVIAHAKSLGMEVEGGHVLLVRPHVHDWVDAGGQPLGPMPGWMTLSDYRRATGISYHQGRSRWDGEPAASRKVWCDGTEAWIIRIPHAEQVTVDVLTSRPDRPIAELMAEPGWMSAAQYARFTGRSHVAVKRALRIGTLHGRKVRYGKRYFWMVKLDQGIDREAA